MSSTDLEASSNGPNLNVLLIIVDDLRPALGSYEDPLALTPNIDRLSSVSYRQVIVKNSYKKADVRGILFGKAVDFAFSMCFGKILWI